LAGPPAGDIWQDKPAAHLDRRADRGSCLGSRSFGVECPSPRGCCVRQLSDRVDNPAPDCSADGVAILCEIFGTRCAFRHQGSPGIRSSSSNREARSSAIPYLASVPILRYSGANGTSYRQIKWAAAIYDRRPFDFSSMETAMRESASSGLCPLLPNP
jgi:hypothetical protein